LPANDTKHAEKGHPETSSDFWMLARVSVQLWNVETCTSMSQNLFSNYVSIPTSGTLRELSALRHAATDCFNRESFYSIIMQGVVDYLFIDVYIS